MNQPVMFSNAIRKCNLLYLHKCFHNCYVEKQSCIGILFNQLHKNSFSSLSKYQTNTCFNEKQNANHLNYRCRKFSLGGLLETGFAKHSAFFQWVTESSVVAYAKTFLIQLHDSSGLPWWMSIMLTTCIVRGLVIFPISIYQNYTVAKLENARKEMDDIVNDIKYDLNREVKRNRWPEKKAKQHFRMLVSKEWTRLIERDNCHPAKVAILSIFQIPTWIIFSAAIRNLVYKLPENDEYGALKCWELSVGGVAWFPNLIMPDAYILPITLGVVNLAVLQIQTMMHQQELTRMRRFIFNLLRGISIIMIPVAATVPSCLSLYWTTSSALGLCQNLAMMSPRFRSLVGIPPTPSTMTNPYSHLVQQIRKKLSR